MLYIMEKRQVSPLKKIKIIYYLLNFQCGNFATEIIIIKIKKYIRERNHETKNFVIA